MAGASRTGVHDVNLRIGNGLRPDANDDADVSALERELDELVYALYDLAPEEIKIVENGTAK
jgi:hypothetical protein